MTFLLDTNMVIAMFAEEVSVIDKLAAYQTAEQPHIPTIVLGELYYGALKSAKAVENVKRIDQLAERGIILGCDSDSARFYAAIKHQLRLLGKPIPENDIWIAAIAKQHSLTLVSRDAHFQVITDLTTAAR